MEELETRPIGRNGVSVTPVGLGGVEIGPAEGEEPDIDRSVAVLKATLAAGINWLDTSENYYGTRNESLIGEGLGRVDGDLLVATKVAPGEAGSAAARASVRTKFMRPVGRAWAGSDETPSTSTSCTGPTTQAFRSRRPGAPWRSSSIRDSSGPSGFRTTS